MSFEIAGKLHKIFPEESKSDRFRVREFVIETMDGNYAQFIKFQLAQERCQLIDNHSEGDEVTVHFDLRGREWQGKYFTTLNCWRLEGGKSEGSSRPKSNDSVVNSKTPPPADTDSFSSLKETSFGQSETNFDDDLPF